MCAPRFGLIAGRPTAVLGRTYALGAGPRRPSAPATELSRPASRPSPPRKGMLREFLRAARGLRSESFDGATAWALGRLSRAAAIGRRQEARAQSGFPCGHSITRRGIRGRRRLDAESPATGAGCGLVAGDAAGRLCCRVVRLGGGPAGISGGGGAFHGNLRSEKVGRAGPVPNHTRGGGCGLSSRGNSSPGSSNTVQLRPLHAGGKFRSRSPWRWR